MPDIRTVACCVPARVGLVGNPSDGHGGAVVATVVPGLAATVTAGPATGLVMPHGDPAAPRIISAALDQLVAHLGGRPAGVELAWTTTIPLSVGLAGSSALAVATIQAVAGCWGCTLDARLVAALALAAETHGLGIAAGWQDRVVQAIGAPVLVDVATMGRVGGVSVPTVRRLHPRTSIRLVLGWVPSAATASGEYHGALRAGAARVRPAMDELARLARRAADAVDAGDAPTLAALVDETWAVRQGVAPLRADHADLVEVPRRCGVAATTPGSGGATVAVPLDDHAQARVVAELARHGAQVRTFHLQHLPPPSPITG